MCPAADQQTKPCGGTTYGGTISCAGYFEPCAAYTASEDDCSCSCCQQEYRLVSGYLQAMIAIAAGPNLRSSAWICCDDRPLSLLRSAL